CAQLQHRRPAARIALVHAKLDPAETASEGVIDHQPLHPPIVARAAHPWCYIGAADLDDTIGGVGPQIAGRAHHLITPTGDEADAGRGATARDGIVEML